MAINLPSILVQSPLVEFQELYQKMAFMLGQEFAAYFNYITPIVINHGLKNDSFYQNYKAYIVAGFIDTLQGKGKFSGSELESILGYPVTTATTTDISG